MSRPLPVPAQRALDRGDAYQAIALTLLDELGSLAADLTVLAGFAETPGEKAAYGLARRLLEGRAREYI